LRHNKTAVGIRWKLFVYLAVFVGITLVLLWLFQVVFLENFYQRIKVKNLETAAQSISENIDSSDFSTVAEESAHENDLCVLIVDENGSEVYSVDSVPGCSIHKMSERRLADLFDSAQENPEAPLKFLSGDAPFEGNAPDNQPFTEGPQSEPLPEETFLQEQPANGTQEPLGGPTSSSAARRTGQGDRNGIRSMVYGTLVDSVNQGKLLILLDTTITPVGATADILQVELIYIVVILLILSGVLSYLLSKKISSPIMKINDQAKELALGNYETSFDSADYREVSQLSDTLNYAAKELSRVEELRRELLANISHDLRTPLTMITGYGEVMRDIPGENTPENVQIIVDESKRLTDLVNDLLDISKLQSGAQELRLANFNLTASVRDILKRYRKLMEQKGYDIQFEQDGDVFVYADEIKISQVIYNLINNALNYTGEDKKIIIRQKTEDGRVKLSVSDKGQGIAETELPYIWDRYYKIDKVHKRSVIGTGLGLSIVKNIIKLHGGEYGVESIPGQGSTFWFSLKMEQKLD